MSTASEVILARYKQTWSETDKLGRTIVIGQIRPNMELAVLRMVGSEERTNQITYLAIASIRRIDETDVAPPRQLADLDAIMNKLDREGLQALGEAYARMKKDTAGPETDEDAKEAVKN